MTLSQAGFELECVSVSDRVFREGPPEQVTSQLSLKDKKESYRQGAGEECSECEGIVSTEAPRGQSLASSVRKILPAPVMLNASRESSSFPPKHVSWVIMYSLVVCFVCHSR